jgi:MYXO-CTERM domain-containing protein
MAVVEMPAELDDGSGGGFSKSIRVQFELDLTKLEGKMIGAFEVAKIGAGAIKLTPDEKVRPYQVLVADKGKYTQKPGDTTLTGALSMVSQKLPDKKYMLGVHLIDYAGNQSTKLVDVSQLLAKAAQQQQQQKTGCAKKCAIGFSSDDESRTAWIAPAILGAGLVVRRRRKRA